MDEPLIKAFSHPLRVRIFERLEERPGSPSQVSREFDLPLAQVAYHFRRLEHFELIRLHSSAKRRGAIERTFEAVKVVPLPTLTRKELPPSLRGHVSAPILEMMFDRGVAALSAGTLDTRDDSHLVCIPTVLDEVGWHEVSAIMDEALADISAARQRSLARLSKSGERGVRTTIIVASFESPHTEEKSR